MAGSTSGSSEPRKETEPGRFSMSVAPYRKWNQSINTPSATAAVATHSSLS